MNKCPNCQSDKPPIVSSLNNKLSKPKPLLGGGMVGPIILSHSFTLQCQDCQHEEQRAGQGNPPQNFEW
jgi:hypothetical protein